MILIIKHISIEGPGIIGRFFENMGYKINVLELEKGDMLPVDLSDTEAVVSLGGPMNVYEEAKYPFLKDEDAFLKRVIKSDIPLMGICLGAQLIVKATGAEVKKAGIKEIGWCAVKLTDEGAKDALFEGMGKVSEFFQWHEDRFDVPDEGVLLAETPVCPQAYRIGKNTYGLQFHFEVTPDMIKSWIEEYAGDSGQSGKEFGRKMLEDAYDKQDKFVKQGHKILLNFARIIEHGAVPKR